MASDILIVDDEPALSEPLGFLLQREGYETTAVADGLAALSTFEADPPDLVLLDLMLPGRSGLDILRELRADPERAALPVVVVTARGEVGDRTRGLELGADDYVPKPFSRAELLARVRAVLRRGVGRGGGPPEEPTAVSRGGRTLRFAGWTLDTGRRELAAPGGAAVELSGAEYDVLLAFLERSQRVLSRDRLLELSRNRLLGDVLDRSVDVLVSRLRRKLGTREDASDLIRTVRGAGYVFTADVSRE